MDASLNEYDLIASICRDSFYDFVKEFWDVLIPEKPVWNWHLKVLCEEIQEVMERVFLGLPKKRNLLINVPPGSTKSTIGSIMLPPWCWTKMPSLRYIGGSYTKELSLDLSRKSRIVAKSEKYQACFPEIEMESDQDVKSYFANTRGGFRYATATGGSVMGFHGHVIVVDDPIDPKQAASEVTLKKASDWMTETLSTRMVDKAVTPIILIMQRLHQNDPAGDMLEMAASMEAEAVKEGRVDDSFGLRHICIPAEKTDKIKPRRLRRFYKKGLMDPVRLPWKVLDTYKAKGDYLYTSQFLQWPVPRGGGMFKTDRIAIDVTHRHIKRRVRFWDKAGTAGGIGAYSIGLKMVEEESGRIGIEDVQRGRWSTEERENRIKQTAQMDGIEVEVGIEQEPGSGGKESAENTVKNLRGFRVFVDVPSGADSSKELRADPFSVQVNAGNVFMVKGDWNREYINELTFFPNSKYKDQVDASSGAFNRIAKPNIVVGAFFGRKGT